MNRFKPREGTQAPYWRHMDYIAESMDQGLRAALADYIAISQDFFIEGAVITSTTSGTNTLHSISAGHLCYKGEVMPVDAHSVVQSASQVVYIEVMDVGVDVAPVLNNDGQTDYVLRRRHARMRTASVYPLQYMSLSAPRKSEIDRLRMKGRLVPKFGIVPYAGPLDLFSATGLGLPGTFMDGWAICNGNNGTPDMRGLVAIGATNVPSTGAPSMHPEIIGNSDVGDLVGADSVLLSADNLPPHTHPYVDSEPGAEPAFPLQIASGSNIRIQHINENTGPNETAHQAVSVKQASMAIVWLMSIA